MKVKKFTTYDQMYNKRVDAFNVIMTPEEKELFEQGLEYAKNDFDTADKLKKFIRDMNLMTTRKKKNSRTAHIIP